MSESNLASDLIHKHLLEFGRGMIESQHPSPIDGLKPVHRRVLVVVRTKLNMAIKSAKLLGETQEIHPHGPSSIYNAAVRMGQSWEYNPPMLDFRSESSGGTYADPFAGADRYTSLRVPEFTYDVFFKGVEYDVLPKKIDESLTGLEPINFVPAVPTALLYANNSIGYGYSSYTAAHNLGDVCDLVVAYAEHRKHDPLSAFDYVKHAAKFLPDFPVQGILTNPEELLEAYREGNFTKKICLDGDVTLTADSITIRTLPYGVPFNDLERKVQELMAGKDYKGGWFDKNLLSVKGLSNEYDIGDLVIKVKRGVNIFEAWENIRKKIQFSGTITPIPNYNDSGYVIQVSQPNLLVGWYNARYNIMVSSKKVRIMSLTESVRKIEALLIVCDHVDECVAIIRSNDRRTGVTLLMARFDLTDFQATYLSGAPLHTLSTTSKDELTERKNTLDNQLRETRESFAKIPDEIARDAIAIKKKYPTPRKTRISNYLGYVRIGGGCIQFESIEEIGQIIEDFPKLEMEIHSYDGPHLYKVSETKKLERGSIPKITTGDIYGLKTNQVVTVNITDGTACCVRGFVPGLRTEGYFYTTVQSRAIYRNGDIKTIDVTKEISLRKTICRGANTNIIYVYPDLHKEHYVIALNTSTPNVIVIQKVTADRSRVGMSPTGEVMVLHSLEKHIFLNVPQKFLKRNATHVVEITNVETLLNGKDQIRVDIGTASIKSSKLIKLY